MTQARGGNDVLRDDGAGARAARGGAVRGIGYALGALLVGVAAIILLRYLGPVEFGQYSAVMALVGIVAGVTEAGLGAVGARDMAVQGSADQRERVLANLIGIRLVVAPVGVALMVLVAWAVGFEGRLILGTLIGGLGVILVSTQTTMMLPLWVDLRIARLTGVEVLRQAVALGAIAALAAAGASLLPFFAVQVVVGLLALAVTPYVVAGWRAMRPQLDRDIWVPLLLSALPVAIAVTLNVVYFRILMVEMEVLSNGQQTGYFATAFRLTDFLIALPMLVTSVALPVLAVAHAEDAARMRAAVRGLVQVSVFGGIAMALVVGLAADPIIRLLGGSGYEPAVPAVQVQALTLIPLFVGQALQVAIVAAHRQRLLIIANSAALVVVLVAGLLVIPATGSIGASWVAVVGETLLVAILAAGSQVIDRGWLGAWRQLALLAACGAAAAAVGIWVPLGSAVAAAIVALVIFLGLAVVSRAVDREVLRMLVPRWS